MQNTVLLRVNELDMERLIEAITGRIVYYKRYSGDKFASNEVTELEKLRGRISDMRGDKT